MLSRSLVRPPSISGGACITTAFRIASLEKPRFAFQPFIRSPCAPPRSWSTKAYPAEPLVWRLGAREHVRHRFGHASGVGKERREKIRLEHEAFWSTGQSGPPNYVPATLPSRCRANNSLRSRAANQAYSCVLPGEIVRQCVSRMTTGTLNAVSILKLRAPRGRRVPGSQPHGPPVRGQHSGTRCSGIRCR